MYLILVLSTVCIFFFQFHMSRAQYDEEIVADLSQPNVRHHQEPMRELLLADPAISAGQPNTAAEDNVS